MWTIGGVYGAGLSHGSKELVERHLLSMYFMLPLIGVCIGFMYHNWCAKSSLLSLMHIELTFDAPVL